MMRAISGTMVAIDDFLPHEEESKVDMLKEPFDPEDVEHIDEAICEIRSRDGSTALPGLEWVRAKVAARVGVELRDEGDIYYGRDK